MLVVTTYSIGEINMLNKNNTSILNSVEEVQSLLNLFIRNIPQERTTVRYYDPCKKFHAFHVELEQLCSANHLAHSTLKLGALKSAMDALTTAHMEGKILAIELHMTPQTLGKVVPFDNQLKRH